MRLVLKSSILCLLTYVVSAYEKTHIVSWDGTELVARVYEPIESLDNDTIVVYINSWGLPSLEYFEAIRKIIEIPSIEYETRGFWGSGGEVDFAGAADLKDASCVIDYALEIWPSRSRIAFVGVSYGGGLSLLAAANDTRITSVVAYSAWVSLYENFNWNASPSRVWADLLLGLGQLTGNLDASIFQIWNDVKTHSNLSYVAAWCQDRDPMTIVSRLARLPVLMLSDIDDGLMLPQLTYNFWAKALKSTRKGLIFAGGTHAEAEIKGLLGLERRSDGPFHRARDWILDRSTAPLEQLTFYDLENAWPYDTYGLNLINTTIPPTSTHVFSLGPPSPSSKHFGTLMKDTTQANTRDNADSMTLRYGWSRLSPGDIPVVSDFLKPRLDLPAADLGRAAPRDTSLVFISTEAFASDEDYVICGLSQLTGLSVIPTKSSFQFYLYLYIADPSGLLDDDRHLLGRLVTYAPFSVWNNATPNEPYDIPPLDFTIAAFRIPKRHRLALGFSMLSNLYTPAIREGELTVVLNSSESSSSPMLKLPIMPASEWEKKKSGNL